jgi:hypothetical protein
MTCRAIVLLALLLAACSGPSARGPLLPESVDNWRRTSLRDLSAADAPEVIPRASLRRVQSATYEGAGKAEAVVYELSSSAASLDVVQRWRPVPDMVFFYRDQYFVTVRSAGADRQALAGFVRALEKSVGR